MVHYYGETIDIPVFTVHLLEVIVCIPAPLDLCLLFLGYCFKSLCSGCLKLEAPAPTMVGYKKLEQKTEIFFVPYRSLLLLFGVPLILFVVFYEAITSASVTPSSQNTVLKDSQRVVHAGQTSIRGIRAQYKTNITQLQTSNIQN